MSSYLYTFSATGVSLLFLVSAVSKTIGFRSFIAALRSFAVVPNRFIRPTALAVVVSELAITLTVVVGGQAAIVGFVLSIASLLVYSVLIVSTLRTHRHVVCNCFGPSEQRVSPWDIGRNATIVMISVSALVFGSANSWYISFQLPVLPIAFFAAVTIVILVINFRDIGLALVRDL